MRKKLKIRPLSRLSAYILHIGMPLMVLIFAYITAFLLNTPANERAWICYEAHSMLEHAIMSLTLILAGAFVADIAQKRD